MRQAKTAIAVYRELQPTLHGRQLFVRQQLENFLSQYGKAPTALELVRFVASQFPQRQIDVNTVRPRLFELEQQGWVQHAEKRLCSITRKRVYTWRLSTPRVPLPEPVPQNLFDETV